MRLRLPRNSRGARGEIVADLDERHDLPVARQRRVESAERVGDAAPFLDRRRARLAPVDHIPDEGADDPDAACQDRVKG